MTNNNRVGNWLHGNYKWLFDGAGVAVILTVMGWFRKGLLGKRCAANQSQRSGSNAVNLQAGKDINVRTRDVR